MSRFRRPPYVTWGLLVVLAALVAAQRLTRDGETPPEALENDSSYDVHHVVDGDTLKLTNDARVRLIGIDAPELHGPGDKPEPLAREATAFVEEAVGDLPVRLRLDKERLDPFGRFLAYVYIEEVLLNEAILEAGLARARTEFNYSDSMKRRFRKAEETARKKKIGIWADGND